MAEENGGNSALSAPVTAVAPAAVPAENQPEYQTLTLTEPEANAPDASPSPMSSPYFLIIIVGVWLVFLWVSRRNSKQREQKRHAELDGIKRGDHVVTIGRIHGVVVNASEKTFAIRPDPEKEFVLTFDREALLRVENDGDKDKKAGK